MDKYKIVLPLSILSGCIILGGFFFATQVIKQQSIERQQQIELQAKTATDKAKAEQEHKEYVVKRKEDCHDYETSERKKHSNVDGSFYDEENDVCKVRYVNTEWREGDPNSCKPFEKLINKESTCTIERYFTNDF